MDFATQNFVISGDIGGSHFTAAVIDLEHKKVIDHTRRRSSVDCQGKADDILNNWVDTIRQVQEAFGSDVDKISLAMPGPFDYEGGVSLITGLDKYESIFGINVKLYLSKALKVPVDHIRLRNDAEAFLHGEVMAGSGRGNGKTVGITFGTGMGSAVSLDGTTRDANWGSDPFGASIADDYFSTRWFVKAYALISKKCAGVRELAELAVSDDDAAGIFRSFARNFSTFIAEKLNEEQPARMVIGGNISKAHGFFLAKLKKELARQFDPSRIHIASLGEDAAMIGAAFTFPAFNHEVKQQSI